MRLRAIAVFAAAAVAGVSAQQPRPSSPAAQVQSNTPKLVAPPDAKLVSSHGDRGHLSSTEAFGGLAAHASYRLQTTMSAEAIADHYLRQLVTAGWKPTLSPKPTSLAFVRFSAGSTDDPLVGILTVVPFPQMQSAVVVVDVLRARPRMPMSGRPGGGGAKPAAEVPILLPDVTVSEIPFPESVRLPETVSRVEQLRWGGSVDSSATETRLETFLGPAELMKIIESQITPRGWTVDVRAGDAVQAVTKFNPLWGGDSTALLLVTSLPTGDVSIILNVYRNRGY